MATNQRPVRPLSIGRAVHPSNGDLPVRGVLDRVPAHLMAPNGERKTESQRPDATPENRVLIALHVPDKQFVSFSKWVADHIRVVGPEGLDVHVVVIPELDGDVDIEQFARPASLTIEKVAPK